MSDDGADLGVGAERALKTVLGGEPQPTEEERQTVEEMNERLRAAPIEGTSYEGTADACARIILEAWDNYPDIRDVPSENRYLKDKEGKLVEPRVGVLFPLTISLHEVLKRLHPKGTPGHEVLSGLTGFMWGWAVNAARRCYGLSPVSNPAIVTIGRKDAEDKEA